jgi:hypothetical protein
MKTKSRIWKIGATTSVGMKIQGDSQLIRPR